MDAAIYQAIGRWAGELSGVFTLADLRIILGDRSEAALYKRLKGLVSTGTLIKIKRGLYATPEASLAALSHRIEPAAYISTGTILARHALIDRNDAVKRPLLRTLAGQANLHHRV